MTAQERRQEILEILCQRRFEKRENLANEFGVTKRTIEHDLLILSMSYPIFTVPGKGGGIRVEEWFNLTRPRMNSTQLNLLRNLLPTLSETDQATMQEIIKIYGR